MLETRSSINRPDIQTHDFADAVRNQFQRRDRRFAAQEEMIDKSFKFEKSFSRIEKLFRPITNQENKKSPSISDNQTSSTSASVLRHQFLTDLIRRSRTEKYKVWLAAIHFDEVAEAWDRSLVPSDFSRYGVSDWESYKILFQERFDDSVAKLHQLHETAGILDYHAKFELISSRVSLPEDYLVRVYISGLRMDTQLYVQKIWPQTDY